MYVQAARRLNYRHNALAADLARGTTRMVGVHVSGLGLPVVEQKLMALEQRLRYYCSTPLNYDPKLHLKCDLVPLDLYVRHTVPLLNPIFRRVAKFLEPTRHDPVLRQFRNADALN